VIALVPEGDTITIDADARLLQPHISDEELRRAMATTQTARYKTGVLAKYAKLVSSLRRCCDRFEL